MGSVPDIDPREIARNWLTAFSDAITAGDVAATAETFLSFGWFRDVLTFTWTFRSLEGPEKITSYLSGSGKLTPGYISSVKPYEDLWVRPAVFPAAKQTGVEVPFSYETPIAVGRGFARVVDDGAGNWRALSVCMFITDLKGHEEAKFELGIYGGHTLAWADVLAERRLRVETEPQVLIVGASQIGLMITAVCKQMGFRALNIERTPRVGDIWRNRYPTLALHTTRRQHELLYQPYPTTWPQFTPKDKFADWLESYAKHQDLVVWTSSQIDGQPVYHGENRHWDVTINRDGTKTTVHPTHIIMATGALGEPYLPTLQGRADFKGTVLHGHHYRGGPPYAGQRVIVVGAANTAIDICQDLWFHKAKSVTMIQRSSTCVIGGDTAAKNLQQVWNDDAPTAVGDLKFRTMPLGLLKKIQQSRTQEMWDEDKEVFDKLRKGGVKLNMGPSGEGQLLMVWQRCGGYWVDKGGADLIEAGEITVKQGIEPVAFTEGGLKFTDGTELEADTIIFATGYTNIRETAKNIFGEEEMKNVGDVFGLDEEGELKGSFKPSGHSGLWFGTGDTITARTMSKPLVLQLKALELGLNTL
ncbi:dimethylaniline monooxygenase (N-oxide-forming) [Cristinia sonorae]|uniref:Dimethylaniline monooxygenase (N-oxide-forming) n=1 Tax=Cristinia sonorae TaxID=1940300 RepID=A0A8K0XR27_9AGAR|nr:dimethylaniline monooxygenase (N-oxide-forming) [Cristinia sonorae]